MIMILLTWLIQFNQNLILIITNVTQLSRFVLKKQFAGGFAASKNLKFSQSRTASTRLRCGTSCGDHNKQREYACNRLFMVCLKTAWENVGNW